ncbi:MAG: hypothetical protein GY703_25345 [Gammaproteobacteria bacterium]|nr:hypothetical protein [Gammaproteobacteria bacterium]
MPPLIAQLKEENEPGISSDFEDVFNDVKNRAIDDFEKVIKRLQKHHSELTQEKNLLESELSERDRQYQAYLDRSLKAKKFL